MSAKGELEFPLMWYGKLVVKSSTGDITDLLRGIFHRLNLQEAEVTKGNSSNKGTYQVWNLGAEIPSQVVWDMLCENLRAVPGIKLML